VLNLYAGIGGNRKLWPDGIKVTAVEYDPNIAEAYSHLWPNDEVIVGDAHQYLADHLLDGWDFVWSSPPCQTHSRLRFFDKTNKSAVQYPKLEQLYGEIYILRHLAPAGLCWVVENVIPFYEALIPSSTTLDRHAFWCGGFMPPTYFPRHKGNRIQGVSKATNDNRMAVGIHDKAISWGVREWETELGIVLPACADTWNSGQRRKVLRNCVDPEIGALMWRYAFQRETLDQPELFTEGQ
jgi:DNA (cytosine-5)-methyltransferase 1